MIYRDNTTFNFLLVPVITVGFLIPVYKITYNIKSGQKVYSLQFLNNSGPQVIIKL